MARLGSISLLTAGALALAGPALAQYNAAPPPQGYAPPPGYGQPPPGYGQQPPGYGQPSPGYAPPGQPQAYGPRGPVSGFPGFHCNASFGTPSGQQPLICNLDVPRPTGTACTCAPPPGYPITPRVPGQVVN